jgi:hypothetical protein
VQTSVASLLANTEWELVQQGGKLNELEVQQNVELLELSRQILELTKQIHVLQRRASPPSLS